MMVIPAAPTSAAVIMLGRTKDLVDTDADTVTLTGHVRTRAERDAVLDAAWMTPAVYDVCDRLVVTGLSTGAEREDGRPSCCRSSQVLAEDSVEPMPHGAGHQPGQLGLVVEVMSAAFERHEFLALVGRRAVAPGRGMERCP